MQGRSGQRLVLGEEAQGVVPLWPGTGAHESAGTVSAVALSAEILARGPCQPGDIQIAWRRDPFEPDAAAVEADRLLDGLRERGSPS